MNTSLPLLAELEQAITRGAPERRAEMLLKIADLFTHGSARFSENEIALFDDVITRLAVGMEVSVREKLARGLAPNPKAPLNISRILASDDEIRVAEPVLRLSERLDDATLMTIARKKGEPYLLAITQRKSLSENLTDVLVRRGTPRVLRSAARNGGARFSPAGFASLVAHANGDDELAACVGSRPDIPRPLLLALIDAASDRVRNKLTTADPQNASAIADAVTVVKEEYKAATGEAAVNTAALDLVYSLRQSGGLTKEIVRSFAEQGQWDEIQVALSLLCEVPIEMVKQSSIQAQPETFLVLAKAADLPRSTAKMLLSLRVKRGGFPASDIDRGMASFDRLTFQSAQQIMKFYRLRRVSQAHDAQASSNPRTKNSLAALEHRLVRPKY
jgi:uncharacterized protein (DUF2336 family)